MHYVVLFSSKSCVTLNRLVSLVRELSQNTTEYYNASFCSVDQLIISRGSFRILGVTKYFLFLPERVIY